MKLPKHPLIKRSVAYALSLSMVLSIAPTSFAKTSSITDGAVPLSYSELSDYASATDLNVKDAEVILDNDSAFARKIEVIKKAGAKDTLRLVYFIFSDDVTSSYLTKELVAAAKRGAKIKMLLDFWQNYGKLDLLTALESMDFGKNKGSIQVKLYNRPTRNHVLHAAYMTMPCTKTEDEKNKDPYACAKEKADNLDKAASLVPENVKDKRLNVGTTQVLNSGLYLSGLYSKYFGIMAKAVVEGQQLDLSNSDSDKTEFSEEQKQGLKDATKLIWNAKLNPKASKLSKLGSLLKLKMAFMFMGESSGLNLLYNQISGTVDVDTKNSKAFQDSATKAFLGADKTHWTDYTHHKLIMRNGEEFVMGGRNVEDSYHTSTPEVVAKYLFMDTDVHVKLNNQSQQMVTSFDKMWGLRSMSATTADAKAVAPNELVANLMISDRLCLEGYVSSQIIPGSKFRSADEYLSSPFYREKKREKSFKNGLAKFTETVCANDESIMATYTQKQREELALKNLEANAQKFVTYAQNKSIAGSVDGNGILSSIKVQPSKIMTMSAEDKKTAKLFYLENLHYNKDETKLNSKGLTVNSKNNEARRIYGLVDYNRPRTDARNFGEVLSDVTLGWWLLPKKEETSTRYIHSALVRGLENVCAESAKTKTRQNVILQNAYFAPPSVLLKAFTNMINGVWNCKNVDLTIITNSFETTDLTPINFVARYAFSPLVKRYNANLALGESSRSARLKYLEYTTENQPEGIFKRSLHSKVAILGDHDMIVGSANADLRSYLMDTNNAMYIKDAPQLVRKYTQMLSELMDPNKNPAQLVADDGFNPELREVDVHSMLVWKKPALEAEDEVQIDSELENYGIVDTLIARKLPEGATLADLTSEQTAQGAADVAMQKAKILRSLQENIFSPTFTMAQKIVDSVKNYDEADELNKRKREVIGRFSKAKQEKIYSWFSLESDEMFRRRRVRNSSGGSELKQLPEALKKEKESTESGAGMDALLQTI